MNDAGDLLRAGDPVSREGGMSAADVNRMRRAIVTAAAEHEPPISIWWPKPMIVAATVAVTLVAGVLVGRLLPPHDGAMMDGAAGVASDSARPLERRQLQFASPGGTRIIWVFDPDFTP